jgi:peptidyl-prolyl cis-trans isomerase D
MIAFIRKFLATRLVLALFALIILAFMITGFGTGGSGGIGTLSLGGDQIAKIGGMSISNNDAAARIQSEFENARAQQPGLTMAEFDRQGGIESTIDRLINSRAILAFGEKHGMVISDRLIDSEIAKTQAFYGVTGKFDRNVYLRVIGDRKLTEKDHRLDVKANLIADQIIPAAAGAARAPKELLTPYASLLLERRFGMSSFIPASSFMGAAPSEAEIKTFYDRNQARYTVPETRVVRYALFDRSRFEGKVSATDADIAAAYKADAAKYAASEKRVLAQAILQNEAAAKALAAKVRSGTPIAKAATDAGFEATTLDPQDKKAYAALSSAAVADAAFAAAQGGVTEPAKSGLGWHVVQVVRITTTAGKSVEQVRSELTPAIIKRKVDEALADMVVKMEDAIADGATFDEVVKAQGLTIVTTPAVTASGIAPSTPGYKAAAELTPILKDAFQSEVDDDPSVVTVVAGVRDAIAKLDRINAAAPKPLAEIQAQVAADTQADRAARAARKAATDLVTKVNAGTPLAKALSEASLPAAQPLAKQRLEIAQAGENVPPALATLFKLSAGKAKMIEEADGKGYTIIWLERLEAGNAKERPDLVQATEGELSKVLGNEYTQQLLEAIKADLGLQRNQATINAVKRSLLGGTATQ